MLYSFCQQTECTDGAIPYAPLILDNAGNIYGTTYQGGSASFGTVFKVDTAGNETVLYGFDVGGGCYPYQGLVRDRGGNLYGTATWCGSSTKGTIFKVGSAGNFTRLHSFRGKPSDGGHAELGHLTMDKSGDLYGATLHGGAQGRGALYKVSKSGTLTLLHSFAGGTEDGCNPSGSVARDKAGNIYGTTSACGSSGNGNVWKVSKKGKETILHNFAGGTSDGCAPEAGVARDSKGNLYGVAYGCGAYGYGALYKLSAKGKLSLLHNFANSDGANPIGEVLRTSNGTLYGTTSWGGTSDCNGYGCGTVWKLTP